MQSLPHTPARGRAGPALHCLHRWALPLLLGGCLALGAGAAAAADSAPPHARFAIDGAEFKLDGRPYVIRSGELHYPRIPRAAWRDRLRKARAMGLNTVTTYAFWSQHEAEPGHFDFSGNRDLRSFIKTAAQEGLNVVLRPGPYVCAEVDFGGLPAWLLRTPGLRVRSLDPRYMAASARFLKRLAAEVGDLQSSRGGPILMLQLENEYGSYGQDHDYMKAMLAQMRAAGFDAPLFTSDGGSERLLEGGTLPGVAAVVNFGGDADDARQSLAALQAWRPQGPRMAGEYWAGWFDHWGEEHHRQAPEEAARTLDWLLQRRTSFNLYMFHGGTSFGWLPGANYSASQPYQPDTTSYDYDAALDEAGRPTPKYRLLREVIAKHLEAGERLPPLPENGTGPQAIAPFELNASAGLLAALPRLATPQPSRYPRSMEAIGQNYGYILYRKRIETAAKGLLVIDELRDYATVLVDGRPVGTLDRRHGERQLEVELPAGATLDILVENMGRIGFGPKLDGERKGITRSVKLNDQELLDWQLYALPLERLEALRFEAPSGGGPAFWRGGFDLATPTDSFLDTRGWGKGQVWLNGQLLGRFWNIGPQQSLYLPASWLRAGHNEVIVFSLEAPAAGARQLRGLAEPVYATRSPAKAP